MGRMYFPGERVKDYLPARESNGDFVGRFGAWLTKQGAGSVYYGTYFLLIACVVIRLIVWVVQTFRNNIFFGILSYFGALAIVWISIIPSIVIAMVVCAIIWLLGWLCYNKWTMITSLILGSLWYVTLDGKMMVDHWMSWLTETLPAVWEWYKNVL